MKSWPAGRCRKGSDRPTAFDQLAMYDEFQPSRRPPDNHGSDWHERPADAPDVDLDALDPDYELDDELGELPEWDDEETLPEEGDFWFEPDDDEP